MLGVQVVVDASDVRVLIPPKRRGERVATSVDSIADSQVVRYRVAAIDETEQLGTGSDPQRIETRQVGLRDALDVSVRVDVGKLSVAEAIQRNHDVLRKAARFPLAQVRKEEEQLVLEDRPANASAKLISRQLSAGNPVQVIEEIVGGQGADAVVFRHLPVPLVGAALGHQVDLSTAAAAKR